MAFKVNKVFHHCSHGGERLNTVVTVIFSVQPRHWNREEINSDLLYIVSFIILHFDKQMAD